MTGNGPVCDMTVTVEADTPSVGREDRTSFEPVGAEVFADPPEP